MRFIVVLCLLLTITGAGMAPIPSVAQDLDDLLDLSLDELIDVSVVSATKTEQKLSEAPAIMSIITRRQILDRGYRTVGEALQSVAGLDLLHDRYQCRPG